MVVPGYFSVSAIFSPMYFSGQVSPSFHTSEPQPVNTPSNNGTPPISLYLFFPLVFPFDVC